ncbi:MAG: tRNA lysidine(34) synthetase TilS [Hyphomicrobiales bacterium]|nr:tRNA lysidine(34) synthetase TilS [Hyphomicrobiales bacterium]
MLLAVSGGPDSLALLALADEWRKHSGVPVAVATVDHGLRPAARGEAEMVARVCEARGLPHAILTWDAPKPSTGLPAAARMARYELLVDHALTLGADTIVTAHHADDQAETVLMRITRGSGPAGLAGMAAIGPAPGHEDSCLRLARPLLATPKADLVALCRAEGLAFAEDPTNADETYRRPQLRRLGSTLAAEGLGRDALLRLAARAGRAERALADLIAGRLAALPARRAPDRFEVETRAVLALPEEALIRLLAAEIRRLTGANPRLERLESLAALLLGGDGTAATLGGALVRLDEKRLVIKAQPPRRHAPVR